MKNKKENLSIEDMIKEVNSLEKQISILTNRHNTYRKMIQEYFDEHELKTMAVTVNEINNECLIATKVERVYIDYFVDKLKENLDPEIFNEVVFKKYEVTDMPGLIELLRTSGVNPKDFKKFLNIVITPNKESIKRLYSTGDITKSDLKGCYEAKIVKSIQIKQKG